MDAVNNGVTAVGIINGDKSTLFYGNYLQIKVLGFDQKMIELKNIKNIGFDCDGVLYKVKKVLFGQVSKKMTQLFQKNLISDLKKQKNYKQIIFINMELLCHGLMKIKSVDLQENF